MAIWQVDLSVIQNEDKTFGPYTWGAADPTGLNNIFSQVYTNFTGYSAKMQVRVNQDSGSTALLTLSSASAIVFSKAACPGGPAAPATNNAFAITVTAAQSAGISPGSYYYDLFVTSGASINTEYMAGLFIVLSSVTR